MALTVEEDINDNGNELGGTERSKPSKAFELQRIALTVEEYIVDGNGNYRCLKDPAGRDGMGQDQ